MKKKNGMLMTAPITTTELLQSLHAAEKGPNEFIGISEDLGWGRIFGGRLIAQGLSAAQQTCAPDMSVHSLHCYFLRIGNVHKPVSYQVERLREGMSHQSRRVLAKQGDHDIFHLTASFHRPMKGIIHQDPMPEVREPEELEDDSVTLKEYVNTLPESYQKRLPNIVKARINRLQPLEIRPEHPEKFLTDTSKSPDRRLWIRFRNIETPSVVENNRLLAYASDFSFLGVALQPHQLNTLNPRVSLASINHVIWFHQVPNMGEWNLFCAHSCQASGGKALVQGQLFNRSGVQLASFAQEGVLRYRGSK